MEEESDNFLADFMNEAEVTAFDELEKELIKKRDFKKLVTLQGIKDMLSKNLFLDCANKSGNMVNLTPCYHQDNKIQENKHERLS